MCHAVSLHHLDTKNKNDARRRMKLVIRSCRATDNESVLLVRDTVALW